MFTRRAHCRAGEASTLSPLHLMNVLVACCSLWLTSYLSSLTACTVQKHSGLCSCPAKSFAGLQCSVMCTYRRLGVILLWWHNDCLCPAVWNGKQDRAQVSPYERRVHYEVALALQVQDCALLQAAQVGDVHSDVTITLQKLKSVTF